MERDGSMNGLLPDLEKLSLEKGRPLDVEDLDDEGWLAASEQRKIVELGSLGEGAGGAVTRCMIQGGTTVFALKVSVSDSAAALCIILMSTIRSSRQTPTQMSRSRFFESSISTKTANLTIFVNTMALSWIDRLAQYRLPWNSVKEAVSIAYTRKSRNLVDGLVRKCLARSPKACYMD